MQINNIQSSTNFNGKFFVAGKRNPKIKNPNQAINDAISLAAEAGNKIIEHCNKNKIPLFVDEYTVESAVLPQYRMFMTNKPLTIEEVPDVIVAHSFLIGQDAIDFRKANKGSSCYSPRDMKIPEENRLDAKTILESIKNNTFDFLNGAFLKEPLAIEEKAVEKTSKNQNFLSKVLNGILKK